MNVDQFRHDDWKTYFSGRWSILSASYWGQIYSAHPFSERVDRFARYCILMVSEKSGSIGYYRPEEIDAFSQQLALAVEQDSGVVTVICDGLHERVDSVLAYIDEHIGKDIPFSVYQEYVELIRQYYPYHIENKYTPEGLSAEALERHLEAFESARVYAEPVFMRTEEFMRALAAIHAEKTGYQTTSILSLISTEFHEYMQGGTLPSEEVLQERYNKAALLTVDEETVLLQGEDADEVEKIVSARNDEEYISGRSAYPGIVRGVARVVLDPRDPGDFQEGDILVATMTRPDYLALMKKASAFVTDGGGILCHAAIVARELKTPCVIGTQNGTSILKNGDEIEVDAEKGIVRKVS